MSTSIFIAKEDTVIQRNLLAQVNMDKFVKPSLLMLTLWYQRKFLCSSTLEGAFDECQDNPNLTRSAMPGDIIHLEGKFYLIVSTGFEEFQPTP